MSCGQMGQGLPMAQYCGSRATSFICFPREEIGYMPGEGIGT